MKKTKLIMPVMAVAAVASIATPIVVSCGNQQQESVNYVDDKDVVKEKLVTFDQYTVATCTLTGFKTDDARKTHYTSVKVINQSFASSDVKAKVVTTSEEATDFSIELTIDAVYTNQIITFDLEFTNPNGMKFVSTGYSLEFRVLDWEKHNNAGAYALINGEDVYFPIENLCSESIKANGVNPTIMDDTGTRSFKRETFNYPLVFRDFETEEISGEVTLPNGFLADLPAFNQEITINAADWADAIYAPGDGFLRNCKSFNSKIHFNKHLYSPGVDFMAGCESYNQPLDDVKLGVPGRTGGWVASGFMDGCKSFNQPLDFSTTESKTVTIEKSRFLRNCTSFNQPIKFAEKRTSFVDFGENLTGLLLGTNAYTQTIQIPVTSDERQTINLQADRDFIATSTTAEMYTKGITIELVPIGDTDKEIEVAKARALTFKEDFIKSFGEGKQTVQYNDPEYPKQQLTGYRNVTFTVKE